VLVAQSLPWICQRGHYALPRDRASSAIDVLERIYVDLGGDPDVLRAGRSTPLPGDFEHPPTGALIEIDESQHFTSARLLTLEHYPPNTPVGFDLLHYRGLCLRWREQSDNYFRTKEARGFGVGGRQKQRAYYDALRDLAAPAMGLPPVIRIAAPTRDRRRAYSEHRDRLLALLS
jgi:hypothetical protein